MVMGAQECFSVCVWVLRDWILRIPWISSKLSDGLDHRELEWYLTWLVDWVSKCNLKEGHATRKNCGKYTTSVFFSSLRSWSHSQNWLDNPRVVIGQWSTQDFLRDSHATHISSDVSAMTGMTSNDIFYLKGTLKLNIFSFYRISTASVMSL